MLVISLTKQAWEKSRAKPGVRKITIYGYILISFAITIIIGLSLSIKPSNEVEKNWYLTQKFDDTLYSLSKQLIAYDLRYDKQTNKIKPRNFEGSEITQHFQWQTSPAESESVFLFGNLSLFNISSYPFFNIKGKMFSFKMLGNQLNNSYKSLDLFSPFIELPPGYFGGPYVNVFSINSADNIFYTKVVYEDEDGISINPIREIYVIREPSGKLIQPRQIFNIDSFNLVKAYLKENNIW